MSDIISPREANAKRWCEVLAQWYAAFDKICSDPDITRVGCMAHVRRKFFDVHKASKKPGGSANMILQLIQKLYKIEEEIKDKTVDERKQVRLKKSKPILTEIKSWLDTNQNKYPPQGLMGKAVTYATNQWQYVINYLKDGRIASTTTLQKTESGHLRSAEKTGFLLTPSPEQKPVP